MGIKNIINKNLGYSTRSELTELCIELIRESAKSRENECEIKFIIEILTNNKNYSSYLKHIVDEIEEYIEKGIYKLDDDEEIEWYIEDLCLYDIESITTIFKQKQLPMIHIDSVIDEVGEIFEKIVGENKGYIRDENGKFHKFGDNNEKYTDLLGLKYSWFKESVCEDDEKRASFIEYLEILTDTYTLYEYNELELIES